jgi:hypothetical protein
MKGLDPMPSKENGSFDALLDDVPAVEEVQALAELKDEGTPAETPEQARIKALELELQERIAKFDTMIAAQSVAPVVEKTEAQKALEHNKAVAATHAVLNAPEAYEQADGDDEDFIVFHVLESGLTFLDKVWWIGQTIRVKRDGVAYKNTVDRAGESWLDDLSVGAQYRRFGKQVVALGPWTGPDFNDEVSKQDATRGTAAPLVTVI